MSQAKDPTNALTFSHRSFGLSGEDDFGIPSSPPIGLGGGGPWKLTVHREISPSRVKAKTPDPDNLVQKGLSVPDVSPNLNRRASCPNFTIPEFSVAPPERGRLLSKRPSIISQTILDQFKSAQGINTTQGPASVIDEQSEYDVSESVDVGLSETPKAPSVVISEVKPVAKKQSGYLASRMASYFKPDSSAAFGGNTSVPSSEVDGVSPATSKKKSYLMKRAAAMTNTDVNAMAPSSM